MEVVYISTQSGMGRFPVAAYTCYSKLFSIHRTPWAGRKYWTLLHNITGKCLYDKFASRFEAIKYLRHLENRIAYWGDDWNCNVEECFDGIQKEYYRGMQENYLKNGRRFQ